jgi:hypothetical protein
MKKRIGWKVCPTIGGKYTVVALLEGNITGNGFVKPTFDTPEEAQKFINSGQADRASITFDDFQRKARK